MTVESQILFPISILVPRCCDLGKSASDTKLHENKSDFPNHSQQTRDGQVQTLTSANTNPCPPGIHTSVSRVSLAKPLLQSGFIYEHGPRSQTSMQLLSSITRFILRVRIHRYMGH